MDQEAKATLPYFDPSKPYSSPPFCCPPTVPTRPESLEDLVSKLDQNPQAVAFAKAEGLDIVGTSYDDSSRDKGSVMGQKITDVWFLVNGKRQRIIRNPNYEDKTADVSIDKFKCTLGNEKKGLELRREGLKELLSTEIPKMTGGKVKNLYLPRDEKVLVRAWASFLPAAKEDITPFNLQVGAYHTDPTDPATLSVVCSFNGTSIQVLTKYNETLYFNKEGKACEFTATRLTHHREMTGTQKDTMEMDEKEKEQNVIFFIQVPLKQKERVYEQQMKSAPFSFGFPSFGWGGGSATNMPVRACASMPFVQEKAVYRSLSLEPTRGLEDAIVGTGKEVGTYEGTRGLTLERDPRYPITITVMFFKVTDTISIPKIEFTNLAKKINAIYEKAGVSGSLVTDGYTGRITETHGVSSGIAPPIIPKELSDKERQAKPIFDFL